MRLFKTTTRRTYRAPRQRAGWSTTVKAKTRLRRWAKRRTKQLWRTAKRRIRRRWRQHQRRRAARNRQIARDAQRFRQRNAKIHAGYQSDTGTLPGQVKLPPQDGDLATCRRCSNGVQYNGGRERWEHTGRGHAECFKPGGYAS